MQGRRERSAGGPARGHRLLCWKKTRSPGFRNFGCSSFASSCQYSEWRNSSASDPRPEDWELKSSMLIFCPAWAEGRQTGATQNQKFAQPVVLGQLVGRKALWTRNSFTVDVLWELQCCCVLFQCSVAIASNISAGLVLGGPSVCSPTHRTQKLHSVVQAVVLDQVVSDPPTERQF